MRTTDGTAERILDVAERLVQTQGFNAFSYADIAEELHITKASLHYHFPTKVTLGARLIARYTEGFLGALGRIDQKEKKPLSKLRAYVRLYEDVLRKDRMCLCGMLAADFATLAVEMREPLKTFFDENEKWLAAILEKGRRDKELRFTGAPGEEARVLVAALEGAMLVARSYGEVARFTTASGRLLRALQPVNAERA